eukprot:TRINITY_DN14293_c0_g1_i1.p1 TRINITY_DN14293_c0_g1~~TRINITY_DN14293_c0_g1_i1.p1  ORF type:complete len:215 (+),score=52.77 TRINITY_DN14293_c0_g1_i1:64-708(+)
MCIRDRDKDEENKEEEGGQQKQEEKPAEPKSGPKGKRRPADYQPKKLKHGWDNVEIDFDDGNLFQEDEPHKISSLLIYHQNDFLYGIQATYVKGDGTKVQGAAHLSKNRSKFEVKTIDIDPDDTITGLGGIYTSGIQSLVVKTLKGKQFVIGNNVRAGYSREYRFDIKPGEHVEHLTGGSIYNPEDRENNDLILSFVGAYVNWHAPEEFQAATA